MTIPSTAPSFLESAFNCPFCDAYASMEWTRLGFHRERSSGLYVTLMYQAECQRCNDRSYWLAEPFEGQGPDSGRMVSPRTTSAPMPHQDMPKEIRPDYEEARLIAADSPRAAAALLRLVIQKLCAHLGEKGKDINEDIGSLVRKGLPVEVQQALDIVRVVGNNAVHPGRLDPTDVAAVSNALFALVNQVVEEMISRPKKLKELFSKLPDGAKQAIKKRDAP